MGKRGYLTCACTRGSATWTRGPSNGAVAEELRRIFEKIIDFDSVNSDFSVSFFI